MRANQFTQNINTSAITNTPQQSNSQTDAVASQASSQQIPTNIASKLVLPPLKKPSNVPPHAPYQPYIPPLRTDATAHSVGGLVLPPLSTSMPYQGVPAYNSNVSMTNPFPFPMKDTILSHTPSRSIHSSKHAYTTDLTHHNTPILPNPKKLKSTVNFEQPSQKAPTEPEIFETSINTTAFALTTIRNMTKSANGSPTFQSIHGQIFKLSKKREMNKYYLPIKSGNEVYPYVEVPEGTPISTFKNFKGYASYQAEFTDKDGNKHKQQVYDTSYTSGFFNNTIFLFESHQPVTVDQFITMKLEVGRSNAVKYLVKVNESFEQVYKIGTLNAPSLKQKRISDSKVIRPTVKLAQASQKARTEPEIFKTSINATTSALTTNHTTTQSANGSPTIQYQYENDETFKTQNKFFNYFSKVVNTSGIERNLTRIHTGIETTKAIEETSTSKGAQQKNPIDLTKSAEAMATVFTKNQADADAINMTVSLSKFTRKQ